MLIFSSCIPEKTQKRKVINLSFPRTGTTSLAGLFEQVGSTHEYMRPQTINMLLDYRENKISTAEAGRFLLKRDGLAQHRIDSAAFFFLEPELVIKTFPEAAFVFVLRDCESWIVSLLDLELRVFRAVREGRNNIDLSYHDRYARVFTSHFTEATMDNPQHLAAMARKIVPDLAVFWRTYAQRVMAAMLALPPEQRLVVRLENFSASAPAFAALAGVPVTALNLNKVHLNRDGDPAGMRGLLGQDFLKQTAEREQKKLEAWLRQNAGILQPEGER